MSASEQSQWNYMLRFRTRVRVRVQRRAGYSWKHETSFSLRAACNQTAPLNFFFFFFSVCFIFSLICSQSGCTSGLSVQSHSRHRIWSAIVVHSLQDAPHCAWSLNLHACGVFRPDSTIFVLIVLVLFSLLVYAASFFLSHLK